MFAVSFNSNNHQVNNWGGWGGANTLTGGLGFIPPAKVVIQLVLEMQKGTRLSFLTPTQWCFLSMVVA